MSLKGMSRFLVIALSVSMVSAGAAAQSSMPPGRVSHFADTSMLKPPSGAKVAVIEWEDLECPACAHAYPFVQEAIDQDKVPLVLYDYHIPSHAWSYDAAIFARFLQDRVSPYLANEYRRQVFASQFRIASKDDLNRFTKEFFAKSGKTLPPVIDPAGQLAKQVNADIALGKNLNPRMYTPTIIVVTPKAWIEVLDPSDLEDAVHQAKASMGIGPAAQHDASKK